MKLFWRKKPADPDIQVLSLQELKIEASHVSDQILKISGLKWSLLFCQARIFSAVDKKSVKAESQKMKGIRSSLSALENLRIRKNMIAARMITLTGGLSAEEKTAASPPDMTPKCEPVVIDLKWRVPMSQKLHAGGYI